MKIEQTCVPAPEVKKPKISDLCAGQVFTWGGKGAYLKLVNGDVVSLGGNIIYLKWDYEDSNDIIVFPYARVVLE